MNAPQFASPSQDAIDLARWILETDKPQTITGIRWSKRGRSKRLQHFVDTSKPIAIFCVSYNVAVQVDLPIDASRLCVRCVKSWIRRNGRPWTVEVSHEVVPAGS